MTVFFVTGFVIDDEPMLLMAVRLADSTEGIQTTRIPLALFRELNNNRQRILSLEETVLSLEAGDPARQQEVLEDLNSLDELLERIGSRLFPANQDDARRQVAVKAMCLALEYWTASGFTKADLAEQSGLWNVYMERDGYFRTQTLDKYLAEESLPQKPRWQHIHQTVQYVLATCTEPLPVRRKLEDVFVRLRSYS